MKIPDPSGNLEPGDKRLGEKALDLDLTQPITGWDEMPCETPGFRKLQHRRTGKIRIDPMGRTLGCLSLWGVLCNSR